MPGTDTIPAPPKGFVLDDDSTGAVPPPPKGFALDLSPQESSAEMDRITRPQSPVSSPPSSARFAWQTPPQARSTAEGLVTEEQERRGGMPLAIQPASGSLANPHPERVIPVPRPNATLSRGATSNAPVSEVDPLYSDAMVHKAPPGRFASYLATPEEKAYDEEEMSNFLGKQLGRGLKEVYGPGNEPGQMTRGATDILQGATKVATPLMVVTGLSEPELAALAVGGATAGGAGAKKLAQLVQASPDTQELAEQVGQIVGGFAGGAAYGGLKGAVSPEDALTELLWKRGYFRGSDKEPISVGSEAEARAVAREMIKQNPAGIIGSARQKGAFAREASELPEVTLAEQSRRAAETAQWEGNRAQVQNDATIHANDVVQAQSRPMAPALPSPAESTFRNIVQNRGGVTLPAEPTLEQATAAYQAALSTLRPDVNGSHIEDAANLTRSWQQLQKDGRFAPTPPPPAPRQPGEPPVETPGAPPPMHSISMEEIAEIGDKIAKLPVEERPQATLAAHTALATELLNQGKLTIDGKVEIVRNQKQAETLAQRLINEEIGRQDAQTKKSAAEPVPAPPAGFTLDESPEKSEKPVQSFAVGDRVVLPKGDTGTVAHANSRLIRVTLDGGGKASVPAEAWGKVKRAEVELQNAAPQEKAPAVAPVVVDAAGGNGASEGTIPGAGQAVVPKPSAETSVEKTGRSDVSKGSIIFARHGETKLDQAGANETVAGWTDEPLDDRGRAAAQKLADGIKDQKPTVIVTSDLPRAKQTAEIVGKQLGIPVQEDSRLRPQHVPETEGLKVGEATPIWNSYEQNPDKLPKGGETWNQARERQDAALKDVEALVAKGEKPVVVTHSRNLEMELGERPKPGGFITRNGREKGGAVEPAKKVESGNGADHNAADRGLDGGAVQRVVSGTVAEPAKAPANEAVSSSVPSGEPSGTGESLHGNAGQSVSAGNSQPPGEPAQVAKAAEAEAPKYKFGSTQANIPAESEASKALESARARISDSDLAGKGKDIGDGGNHVTVRYGIKGEDTERIKTFLSQQSPFEASLGKTEKFPVSEHSEGASPIIAPIEAPELHRLNAELEKHGDFAEPSFKEYKPHATVAYVAPDKADRYVGMDVTYGKKFTVSEIAISKKDGSQEVVKLEGKKQPRRESWRAKPVEAKAAEAPSEETKPGESWRVKSEESLAPGKVGEMKVSDLRVDPHRFQYKLGTDAEGVGTLLKETKVWNPEIAGLVSVWRDPANGKFYIINGHHRYELAKRLGVKSLVVRHIVAPDAMEARAMGALQNISDGRGTAIDAAKFFHDTGATPEKLKEKGISLGEKTASDGLAMSRLDPSIFAKVVSGDLRQGRAIAIGEATDDPAEQKAILSLVERKERGGAKVSDDTLSELIRLVKGSGQTSETTADLFGTQQINRSLALEKAEISAHIKQQLSRDKKLFGFVAKENRATELARAGNKIDVEKSKEISTGAAQAEEVYNLLSARGGPIADILDEAARQLADGDNAASVKSEAYSRIRAEVSKTLGGVTGSGAGRSEGTPENPEDRGPALFSLETELRPSEVAPPFYSKAAHIAFDKLPSSGSGQSFLATLRNAGVKEDEIKWIGLDDFLKDKPKATKAETLSYIMKNMVQVREVAKGGGAEPVFREGFPTREAMFTHVMGDDMLWSEAQGGLKPGLESRQGPDGKWNLFDSKQPSTKYASYTLPGDKKNYTELLMTLPTRPRKVMDTIAKEMGFGGWTNALTEEQKDKVIAAFDKQPDTSVNPFKSAHFEEPNILAHVRFDERKDADGKPMLFVEEVQSDLHQQGKKHGYRNDEMRKVAQAYSEYRNALRDKYGVAFWDKLTDAERARYNELSAQATEGSPRAVPNAPFKSDWHELAMKTMLRKAAEGGYDKIGWVTGEQTAERYDISKQIESLNYDPDNQRLVAKLSSGSRHIDKQIPPEQLPDYIGKEAAQRLLATDKNGAGNHELKDTGLKIGGEWAKNLYDRAIPNFLSKYGKKWGAKVSDSKIAIGSSFGENEKLAYDGPTPTLAQVVTAAQDQDNNVTVRNHLDYIAYDMRRGLTFAEAMDKHGSPAAAEALGGHARFVQDKDSATIHSLTVTPEMRASVLSEGQPLFSPASRKIEPSSAKEIEFQVKQTEPGLPSYLRLNPPALEAINRAIGVRINGVNLQAEMIPGVVTNLKAQADTMTGKSAEQLRKLADAMLANVDKNSGLSIIRQGATEAHELATLHEELLHAIQREGGKGDLSAGLPADEILKDPGIARVAAEGIAPGFEAAGMKPPSNVVMIAESMVDLLRGDAGEFLTPAEITESTEKYFEAAAQKLGIESVQRYQAVQDFIAKRKEELGVDYGKDAEAARQAGQRGLTRVLSKMAGGATGRAGEGVPGKSGPDKGGLHSLARRGAEGVAPSPDAGQIGRGNARTSEGSAPALHSTQPIGLSDEELTDWSKSKGFRVEPAGEQLDIFGGNQPVMRVFRAGRGGKEQKALVYQSQIEQLQQTKSEPTEPFALTGGKSRDQQPTLFGAGDLGEIVGNPNAENGIKLPPRAQEDKGAALFSSERGEFKPGELARTVAEAAGTIGDYVREVNHSTELARNLQRGLATLDTAKQADILRGVHIMRSMKSAGMTKADDAAVYHHLEDPDGVDLKGNQDKWLDDVILPLQEQNSELYKELSDGGVPIENYVHRVVKGKAGMLDRIATGAKGIGSKGTLSKSAPQTKHRTYMALENQSAQQSLGKGSPQKGERVVVSIKNGQVTAWRDGEPENLGGISHTDEGKVFEDKDGNIWTLKQATSKEIEKHTETEYYHSALASSVASNIQLASAVRALRFLNAYKSSPEFKEIAWNGQGNPPKGWKTTTLPQFRGYYFEPRTAEVLNDYADRLDKGQFGVLETAQKFLRAAYLLNPIVHPLNVAASFAFEKGLTGFAPWKWKLIYKTGNRAIKAVLEKNQDFLDALDAGAALQSHREDLKDIHKLFFDRLAEGLDQKEHWPMKLAEALGVEHGNLLNLLHKPSSIAAWFSSDVMYLQAAYQYQSDHPGTSLADAFKEVGKIIPEYRLPSRIADSRLAAKAMGNPLVSWFGAYHYGLLKSFAESAKSALGAAEPAPGRSKSEEVGKGWDRLAMLGLITMVLFPYVFDKAAEKLTGDKHARWRRPGPAGYVDAAVQVGERKEDVSSALQKVVTPSPLTKGAVELVTNHDLFSGHEIYDPHAPWDVQYQQLAHYLLGDFGVYGQYKKAETSEQKKKFFWQQGGVQFAKTRAEKVAGDIAASKVGTEAEYPEDHKNRVERREILDQLRQGNRQPLKDAEAKHEITHRQVLNLEHRAKLEPLEDTVHNFTIAETEKVLEAARKDGDEHEIKMLEKTLTQKKARARYSWQTQAPQQSELVAQ